MQNSIFTSIFSQKIFHKFASQIYFIVGWAYPYAHRLNGAGEKSHLLLSGVDLGQAAFAGFAEAVAQVDAGLVHGPADHVVADVTGTGEEVAHVAGVHGPQGGHGIALDAGDLDETADGVAGQTQMVLHGDLCRVLHLIQVLTVELRQGGGGHGAGGADLGLTAALGAGDGGVALGQAADDARGGEAPDDLLVGEAPGDLGIAQHGREDTAGAAGGGGDDQTVVGVLLRHRVGEGGDHLEFLQGGEIVLGDLFIEEFRLPLHPQAAGQGAGGVQAGLDGVLHDLPDLHQEGPDLFTLVELHIVGKGVDVTPVAEITDLGEGVLGVDLRGVQQGLPGDADVAAADGLDAHGAHHIRAHDGLQVHGVRMHAGPLLPGEDDARAAVAQGVAQHPVGAVANAGLA